ncbi:hypothetical protein [Kineosporia succinea]|uniref:Polyhydroxyalkanoate synthesis regulator phasin n=1 Tax=Kineosporia succinea TaxID=84632 RepID=A0ABT9P7R1_9ACTN|nr:hypothetical protein [Kineosporia succinea]MDP9828080.1 polyhydroxyalkanoate synthesis regulator phasin [Kineosporia succinea]
MRTPLMGVAAGAVVLGIAGFAAYPAFADDTPTDPPAASASPTPPGSSAKGEDRIQDALKDLVTDGTITQDQADKVAEKLAEKAGPHLDLRIAGPFGVALDEVAKVLGVDRDEVESALADGKSIKELAQEKGKSVDDVVDALVTAATAKIDQAVKDGRLEQDRADDLEAKLRERITSAVENALPKPPEGGPRFQHRGGPGQSGEPSGDERSGNAGTGYLGAA